jgi:hypothetical protein
MTEAWNLLPVPGASILDPRSFDGGSFSHHCLDSGYGSERAGNTLFAGLTKMPTREKVTRVIGVLGEGGRRRE